MNDDEIKLNTGDFQIVDDADNTLIKRYQEIPQAFLDDIADHRNSENVNGSIGDLMFVGRIPSEIVDYYMRSGFNIFEESGRSIVARLKADGFDKLIATNRSL